MSFLTTTAIVGAGTSLYGAYQASQNKAPSGGYGNASLLNPGQLTGNLNSYGNDYTSAFTNNTNNALLGGFDASRFFNANPEALQQYQEAIGNGGLQGWSQQQFAQAYLGGPENGHGQIGDYRSGGILDSLTQAQPYINQLNQAQNPNISALQNQFAQQAQNGLPQNGALSFLGDLTKQGFGGNYQAQQFDPSGLMANTNFSSQTVNAPNSVMGVQAQGGNSVLNSLMARSQGSGQDSLLRQQNQMVGSQLALGGQLSPDQLRAVQQSSRAGFASRGLDATNASVVDEALQTQAAQQAMYQQRLANAQGVETQNQSQANMQNQLGLGASSQALGYGQLGLQAQQSNQNAQQQLNQFNLQGQLANQSSNLQAQGLGLQAQVANQNFGLGAFNANSNASYNAAQLNQQAQIAQAQAAAQAAGLYQQGQGQNLQAQQLGLSSNLATYQPVDLMGLYGLGNSITSGFNNYGMNTNDTLYNAGAAAGISNSNNNAALYGGLMGLGGNLLGSSLGSNNYFGGGNNSWLGRLGPQAVT